MNLLKSTNKETERWKKMMWGNHIVKAFLKGWDGSTAIRTVYLDKEGNMVVKANGYIFKLSDKLDSEYELF